MEFETIGQRLYYLRRQCRLSRKEIEKNFGVSLNSLKTWEDDSRRIKKEHVKKLVNIYKAYGVHATEDWILGLDGSTLPFSTEKEMSEDAYILKEIANFESFYDTPRLIQVTDDYMSPWIINGDYVGGVLKSQGYLNKVCIIETKDFGTLVRLVEPGEKKGFYNLKSFSNVATLFNVPVEKIYVVILLRRQSYSIH